MAVLVEAFSVIVRRRAIVDRYPGGWPAFLRAIPNATLCDDDHLVRVGFMTPTDVEAFVGMLEAGGLIFCRDGETEDIAVVDQLRGPTLPAPWLEVHTIELFEPRLKVAACCLAGQELGSLALPGGWKYEGSLSEKSGFIAQDTLEDRVKYLRHENGVAVYLDLLTDKEVFLGRPTFKGDTEGALNSQLLEIFHDALNCEGEIDNAMARGDRENAARMGKRLREELLPETERISNGPGRSLGFAHFTRGLVLRILKRLGEAESALLRANELHPRALHTLRELVRVLGEQGKHREALPYAREASEVGPVDAGAWGNLAMCLIQSGDREEARKAINFAMDLAPQDPINRRIVDNFENYFIK